MRMETENKTKQHSIADSKRKGTVWFGLVHYIHCSFLSLSSIVDWNNAKRMLHTMPTISGEFSRVEELNVKNNEWVAPQWLSAAKVKASREEKTQRNTKPAVITEKNGDSNSGSSSNESSQQTFFIGFFMVKSSSNSSVGLAAEAATHSFSFIEAKKPN